VSHCDRISHNSRARCTHASAHRVISDPGKRRYLCGSWQSLLVVTPLFAAAEMRRQMTEAGVRVRARLWPFVAEFLSDVQLSLRFNSLNSTGANASVCYSFAFYFRLNRLARGATRPNFCAR